MSEKHTSAGPRAATPTREILRIALPAALGLLSYAVMQAIDCALLGHYSKIDQAGAGLTFIPVWALMSPVLGTMTGIATFSAQYVGGGRYRRAGRHLRSALALAVVVSIPYFLFAALAPDIVHLFHGHSDMATAGGHYLRIRLFGVLFMAIGFGTGSFLRGTGDAITPLKVSLIANALNLVLDYLLIFGRAGLPEMGVRGAALATVLAQAFEAASFLYLLFSRGRMRREFGIGIRGKIHLGEVRRLIRVGGPIGAYWFNEAVAWAVFFVLLGSFEDPSVMAASFAAFQVWHLSFLPVIGLLQAAQAVVGQYMGAREPATARHRGFLCMRLGVAFMLVMTLLIFLFRGSLIAVFSPDPEVAVIGAGMLIWVAVAQPFDAMAMTALGSLRGAGDTGFAFWGLTFIVWIVFLPASYLIAYPLGGGPTAAWIGAVIFLVCLGAVTGLRLRSRAWEGKRV